MKLRIVKQWSDNILEQITARHYEYRKTESFSPGRRFVAEDDQEAIKKCREIERNKRMSQETA
jgi:hypothetical protein